MPERIVPYEVLRLKQEAKRKVVPIIRPKLEGKLIQLYEYKAKSPKP